MAEAERLYFDFMYVQEAGIATMLTSDVAFVDDLTAPFYGVPSPGSAMTRVALSERPGFLTRLGFLVRNATTSQADPIHRGLFILRNVLCFELPAPPVGQIPQLPPFEPGMTNRQRIEVATSEAVCAQCHEEYIDPLGFAFEHFDAMGQTRTVDNGQPIDASGSFPFPDQCRAFVGASDLIDILAREPLVHDCYAARLTEFLLTRELDESDTDHVREFQDRSYIDGASTRQLAFDVIRSPLFTHVSLEK